MELRTLRYFLTTANEGNISRAADILHVTQPTLSRQLMELERELGAVLMVRGKKGVTLTDDGVFFRQRAEEIVELADRAEKAFAERDNAVSGIITIGATEAVGSRLLAKIMKRYASAGAERSDIRGGDFRLSADPAPERKCAGGDFKLDREGRESFRFHYTIPFYPTRC